jgi:hypothetical protein
MAAKDRTSVSCVVAGMIGGIIGAWISLIVVWKREIAELYVYGLGRDFHVIWGHSPCEDMIRRLGLGTVVGIIAGMMADEAKSPRMAAWMGLGFGFLLSCNCLLPPSQLRE